LPPFAMLLELLSFVVTARLCLSSPLQSASQSPSPSRNHSTRLSALPTPECFTFTLAPPLKQNQCNDELEWFLEEQRKYDYLEFVGAKAPYIYTRPRTAQEQSGPCFVTVLADDLFVTDEFTYGDLARFTREILEKCKNGRMLAGKGGMLKMTDANDDWGGFYLRVDAWNPYPGRSIAGSGTVWFNNVTFPLPALRLATPRTPAETT